MACEGESSPYKKCNQLTQSSREKNYQHFGTTDVTPPRFTSGISNVVAKTYYRHRCSKALSLAAKLLKLCIIADTRHRVSLL